jgi:putative endopeptidase
MKTQWLCAAAVLSLMAASPAFAEGPDEPARKVQVAKPKPKPKPKAPAVKPVAAAPAGPAPDLSKAVRMGAWGFDLAGRDTATAPGQDFFQYANGTYEKTMVIPADRVSFGSFDALNDLSQARLHQLLDKTAADAAATGESAQVGALYRSFMDEAKVNALGAKPMAADLAAIKAEKTKADVARAMGRSMHTFGGSVFGASTPRDMASAETEERRTRRDKHTAPPHAVR